MPLELASHGRVDVSKLLAEGFLSPLLVRTKAQTTAGCHRVHP